MNANIKLELPKGTIESFDCARINMGVIKVDYDFSQLINLTNLTHLNKENLLQKSLKDQLDYLENLVQHISQELDRIIHIRDMAIWDLGKESKNPWEWAPVLADYLIKFSEPKSTMIYEFQMQDNIISRSIGNMLVYHYSFVARAALSPPLLQKTSFIQKFEPQTQISIKRVQPAQKNKVVLVGAELSRDEFYKLCPVVANTKVTIGGRGGTKTTIGDAIFLTTDIKKNIKKNITKHQEYLKLYTDTYKANKMHTTAIFEYWCSIFNISLSGIEKKCYDDAADAFVQILGFLMNS